MRRTMLVVLALLAGGCATTKKLYDGPERAPGELAAIGASNSYVFSVNDRRTDHAQEPRARLLVLPGTQQLIVHLDERMASSYGHVGVRIVFCAQAGRSYTVHPVADVIARLWEPAVRDEAIGRNVSPRPCAGEPPPAEAPPSSAAPPAPAPERPVSLPAPLPDPPPPAAAAPAATPAEPTSPAGPPAPASAAPPTRSATPVPPPPPGVLAPGAPARLRAPARTRSLPDAPAVKGLDAGVAVTLKVVLKKDTGPWWYVTAPAGSGWIRESELEPITP